MFPTDVPKFRACRRRKSRIFRQRSLLNLAFMFGLNGISPCIWGTSDIVLSMRLITTFLRVFPMVSLQLYLRTVNSPKMSIVCSLHPDLVHHAAGTQQQSTTESFLNFEVPWFLCSLYKLPWYFLFYAATRDRWTRWESHATSGQHFAQPCKVVRLVFPTPPALSLDRRCPAGIDVKLSRSNLY